MLSFLDRWRFNQVSAPAPRPFSFMDCERHFKLTRQTGRTRSGELCVHDGGFRSVEKNELEEALREYLISINRDDLWSPTLIESFRFWLTAGASARPTVVR